MKPKPTPRARLAADARHLTAPRTHVSHHCAGTDGCVFCAEMREAHRREELGVHCAGASRVHTVSPIGTGDTTRRSW